LEQFYEDADIVVVPSEHENFALTAVEAIARGCVLVITDRCGFATFDGSNSDNGIFVVSGGAEAARSIWQLSTDSDRLSALKHLAFEHSKNFTWEQIGEAYLPYYESAQ
jgi:glycosyltransferase involved in cell wall biosynthesis